MPWCPKCRNEYVEGVTVCTDCGVNLEDELKEKQGTPIIFGEENQMERLKEFLFLNDIKSAQTAFDPEDDVYEIYVRDEDREKAFLAVKVFMQEEESGKVKEILPKEDREIKGYPMPHSSRNLYENSEKKAEENRSSAYMLLIIGSIGLIVMILIFMEIIPLSIAAMNRYMISGVMGGLFVLFIVMGVVSMKSSRILAIKAETENTLKSEITKWCKGNMTAEFIDADLFEEGFEILDEMKYFNRVEKMKKLITHQFMNLDEAFLDSFTDEYYPEIFETDQNIG